MEDCGISLGGNKMNLIVTTLGTSWQIVPELFAITNPSDYDFFCSEQSVNDFRSKNCLVSIDEFWVITTEGQKDIERLEAWAKKWNCNLHIFICKDVNSFQNEAEITKMRSFIYRIVLAASKKAEILYLSLSGGRKTMSADMQEAGTLFGCDAMLHIVDVKKPPENFKNDALLSEPKKEFAECYIPLIVNQKIEPSLIVSADTEPIKTKYFPFIYDENLISQTFCEDCKLADEIQNRKNRSSQVYANFYSRITDGESIKRDIFRKLYFLHPLKLQKLKEYDIKRNRGIFHKLPKAELHSHLGGVLSPKEIIQVAETEENYVPDKNNQKSNEFKNRIQQILKYKNHPNELEKLIYGNLLEDKNFTQIGIEKYQKLGDFQGSSLLQTENTITRTLEIYSENLKSENVKYVEIRCSPYKYTQLGLSIGQVVNCMMNVLNRYSESFEYRFIYIIGRQASKENIKESIRQVLDLIETNKGFSEKLVGIDLAGNEGVTKPSELREEFMPLLEKCINITIHAGETESVESIWEAVYHLSADRIGHGLKLLDNEELLKRFIDKNIGVEMCPSSNFQIVGFNQTNRKYPLLEYINRGIKVCINTDDQGISRTNLTKEFERALELCPELTLWDFIVLIRNSISMAFCDSKTKNKLMHIFEDSLLTILGDL